MAALLAAPLLADCARGSGAGAPAVTSPSSTLPVEHGLRVAGRYRVAAITARRFTHEAYWQAVQPSLASGALRVEEIGRSMQGRAIRSVNFGIGPTSVLLWSQMHGDEATATMALADIFRFFAEANTDPLRSDCASDDDSVSPDLNPTAPALPARRGRDRHQPDAGNFDPGGSDAERLA